MAKNKNKNKNKNSNQGNKNVDSRSKVVTVLTQEQVDKIDKFLEEEMPTEAIELSDEELVETKEDAQKIEDIKKSGNVDGYISKLHDMLVRIKAIEKKADEIKEQHLKDQATLASDKKTFEDYKKEEEKKDEEDKKEEKKNLPLQSRTKGEKRTIDTRADNVELEKYNDLLIGLLSAALMEQLEAEDLSRKLYGEPRRFFRMAPIHHHFEKSGWSEEKINYVFAAVNMLCGILACILIYFGV